MITHDDIDRSLTVLKSFGALRVLIFGSAKTDPTTANDLDLACSGISPRDYLLAVGTLLDEVGKPVDLVDLDSDSYIARHAERFGRVIYGDR